MAARLAVRLTERMRMSRMKSEERWLVVMSSLPVVKGVVQVNLGLVPFTVAMAALVRRTFSTVLAVWGGSPWNASKVKIRLIIEIYFIFVCLTYQHV